jgi:hypothetical protein
MSLAQLTNPPAVCKHPKSASLISTPVPYPKMSATDPTRLTTSEFRKVELQSPSDLSYLVALTQRAARQKIDVAFPPSAAPTNGEEDGMRRRVEELVSQFVEKAWEGVRLNVSCNGVDMAEREGREAAEGECDASVSVYRGCRLMGSRV